ncbi:hypothetical protein ACHAQH_002760 [Verticillium albo-atrum]
MADNLETLRESVVDMPTTAVRSPDGQARPRAIDANLLRNILIYERAGQPDAMPDHSMFCDNLVSAATAPDSDCEGGTVEYGLVGSASMEGHSSNKAKQTPLYPPEHVSPAQTAGDVAALAGVDFDSVAQDPGEIHGWGCVANRYGESGALDPNLEGLSFQAEDFGRAISGWMNLQLG